MHKVQYIFLAACFVMLAGFVTEASAAVRKCPITNIKKVQQRDGAEITVVFCDEFYGPLLEGAEIRSSTSGKIMKIEEIVYPVHAVVHTQNVNGDEMITSIDIGRPADPKKILYK